MDKQTNIVYHYCSVSTFKNILESKVLWLSDLTDSNDEQEMLRSFEVLWEGVKQRLRKTDLPKEFLNQAITLIDLQYKLEVEIDYPYGVCFCRERDLLSQWIEYGDKAKGLSVGFDLNWFVNNGIQQQRPHPNAIQSRAIGWDNVIYHSDAFEEQMAINCYNALKKNGITAWFTVIRPTFKCYSGFVKNPSFEAEQEVRIAYYPMEEVGFMKKDIDISELKTNVKNHYEIPWVKADSQAIKSICIGHNCKLEKADIYDLLESNGLSTNIEITESVCSYRIRE